MNKNFLLFFNFFFFFGPFVEKQKKRETFLPKKTSESKKKKFVPLGGKKTLGGRNFQGAEKEPFRVFRALKGLKKRF